MQDTTAMDFDGTAIAWCSVCGVVLCFTNPVLRLWSVTKNIDAWAAALKDERLALFYASREAEVSIHARRSPEVLLYAHQEVGRGTKLLLQLALAYALSPIAIFPAWVPLLGWLDGRVLAPALLWTALHALPTSALTRARLKAATEPVRLQQHAGAAVFVGWVWFGMVVSLAAWLLSALGDDGAPLVRDHFELCLVGVAAATGATIGSYLWSLIMGQSIFSSYSSRALGFLNVGVVKRGDSLPGCMPPGVPLLAEQHQGSGV